MFTMGLLFLAFALGLVLLLFMMSSRLSRAMRIAGWGVSALAGAVGLAFLVIGPLMMPLGGADKMAPRSMEAAPPIAKRAKKLRRSRTRRKKISMGRAKPKLAPKPVPGVAPRSLSAPPPTPPSTAPSGAAKTSGSAGPDDGGAEISSRSFAPTAAPTPTPTPTPTPGAAPESNAEFDTVGIFFGTDRKRADKSNGKITRVAFGGERGRKLVLGKADVTIPKNAHARGVVERPWELTVIGITLYREEENPKKHFTISKIGVMSEADFINSVNRKLDGSQRFKDHALVFVHGFNMSFDSALYRMAQMVYDLGFDGAPFLYSWPSANDLKSYEYDQNSSAAAEKYLRDFLHIVSERTKAQKIHLIAHSMGNMPLLRVLQDFQIAAEVRSDLKIQQIILAAPDVDRDLFESIAAEIVPLGKGVTLYASANDKALWASASYAGGLRAGEISDKGPTIVPGIDTIDVSATSTDVFSLNHNTYAERSELLKDMAALMLTGVRPPRQRTPGLQPVTTDHGAYWRFPEQK